MTKKLNRKEWERLQRLNTKLTDAFASNTQRQSETIWRGDWRAIQWACWWIRETAQQES